MKCYKCEKEIQDDFKICPYCGTKVVNNPVTCINCGEVVSGDFEICTECGKRLDGKKTCPNCGITVDPDFKFCPKCAFNLEEKQSNKENESEVGFGKGVKNSFDNIKNKINKSGKISIFNIIGKSIISLLCLIMFIFSFTNIHNVDIDLSMIYDDISVINTKASTFDMIGASFVSGDYSINDYEDEYHRELRALNSDEFDIYDVEDALNQTNVMKFFKAILNENGSSYDIDGYIASGIISGLLLIFTTGAFFAYSLYELYKEIFSKDKKTLRYPIFETGIIALFVFTNVMSFDIGTFAAKTNGMLVTVLIFSIICALLRLAITVKKERVIDLGEATISGLRMVLYTLIIIFTFTSTISLDYKTEDYYDDVYSRMEYKYNMKDCIEYHLIHKDGEDEVSKSHYDDLTTELIILADSENDKTIDEYTKYYLSPYAFELVTTIDRYDSSSSLPVFLVASIFQFISLFVVLALMCYELGFKKNKKSKITFASILFVLHVVVFITSLVAFSEFQLLVNDMKVDNIKSIGYEISPIITSSLALGILLIQFTGSNKSKSLRIY